MFLLTEYQPSSEGGTRSPPGGPKMVDGVWKGVNPLVFGRSKQLLQNKFFDQSTPSMRKGRDGGNGKKTGGKKKTDGNSGHFVVASSRPPERRPLERRTLAPIKKKTTLQNLTKYEIIQNLWLIV